MKIGSRILAVALAMASAPSVANAAVIINGDGSVTLSGSGGSFSLNFDGFGGSTPAVIAGLTSTIDFGFVNVTNSGKTFNLTYNVRNTSSAPITDSRVSGFGFDTAPNISSASSTGIFSTVGVGNVPNFGNVEVCFKAGGGTNNCAGGGGTGVAYGASGSGTIALNFASAPVNGSIALSNFFDRYQSIAGAGQVTSAIGRPVTAVPEPAAWALMLFGFGLAGVAMRRRTRVAFA